MSKVETRPHSIFSPFDMKQGKYSYKLKKGGNNLKLVYFERAVLDRYKHDPRFKVVEYGVGGYLSIKDEYYLDESVLESEKVAIQSFVKGYKHNGTEVVGTLLIYLSQLSPEHQNYWASYEVAEVCKMDADSFQQEFMAEFTDRVSPFDAILQELKEINQLCDLMGEPHLFIKVFDIEDIDRFGWITKPTMGEFSALVHILDKLFSENLNKDFFRGKIPLKDNSDKDKGTISLLEEYMNTKIRFPDPGPKDEMIGVFRSIRKDRQKPAHKVSKDKYDPKYLKLQKDLIYSSYSAIRTLRLIFMNHPKTRRYKPPEGLQKGRIV